MENRINQQVVQQCYAEFGKGNIPGLIENFANDIEWINPGGEENYLAGTYRGKKEVADFFQRLSSTTEYTKFEPREFLTDADKVVVLGYSEGHSKFTGRNFKSDWVMVWTVNKALVKRYIGFFDSAAFISADRANKDNLGIIQTALAAVECYETGNIERGRKVYHEEFQLSGPVPFPLNREQYFEMAKGIAEGIPNWSFNISNISVNKNVVTLSVQITGTHTGLLRLPIPGFSPIPATGKTIKIPKEELQITVENNRVSSAIVSSVPGGGIPGMLEQIGHPLPNM
jgi:uncharacterized protein